VHGHLAKRLTGRGCVSAHFRFLAFFLQKSARIARLYLATLFISAWRVVTRSRDATTKESWHRACSKRAAGSPRRPRPRRNRDVSMIAAIAADDEDGSSSSRNSPRAIKLPPRDLSRITITTTPPPSLPAAPCEFSRKRALSARWIVDHRSTARSALFEIIGRMQRVLANIVRFVISTLRRWMSFCQNHRAA